MFLGREILILWLITTGIIFPRQLLWSAYMHWEINSYIYFIIITSIIILLLTNVSINDNYLAMYIHSTVTYLIHLWMWCRVLDVSTTPCIPLTRLTIAVLCISIEPNGIILASTIFSIKLSIAILLYPFLRYSSRVWKPLMHPKFVRKAHETGWEGSDSRNTPDEMPFSKTCFTCSRQSSGSKCFQNLLTR